MKSIYETYYSIWSPEGGLWTVWVKPVLFSGIMATEGFSAADIPKTSPLTVEKSTMVILDLPGKDGVCQGLALAKAGFRPVPLYNGVAGPSRFVEAVETKDITAALFGGAKILDALDLPADAPPVFMLDSNRMQGFRKSPGKFDNRWCVFPQDMPSAAFLLKNNINKVIVWTDKKQDYIQKDLTHILYHYQEKGIGICHYCNDVKKDIKILKPNAFKKLSYRFRMISELTRNTVGGFGGIILDNTGSSSG